MNKRQLRIIELLKDGNGPFTTQSLSEIMSVSKRTIQDDINQINIVLKKYKCGEIQRTRNNYETVLDDEKYNVLLVENLTSDYYMSKNERIDYIYNILLLRNEYISIDNISNTMRVSRTTAQNDLKQLRKNIETKEIKIITDSKSGIKLSGKERDIRSYCFDRYFNNVSDNVVIDSDTYYRFSICNRFFKFWNKCDSKTIYDSTLRLVNSSKLTLTNKSFLLLLSYIELTLARLKIGNKAIELTNLQYESVKGTNEFRNVCGLLYELSEKLSIDVPLIEAANIAMYFISFSIAKVGENQSSNNADLQIVACSLIDKICQELKIKISKESSIYQNLVVHIKPAIFRIDNGISIDNPLIGEIKEKYKEVYDCVSKNIVFIENLIGKKFSDAEKGYIAIHFIPVYDDQKSNNSYTKVLVVCDGGIGTSVLVANRIRRLYSIDSLKTIPLYELKREISNENYSLIITTINFEIDTIIPIVKVSAFITNNNIMMLDNYLLRKQNKNSISRNVILKIIHESHDDEKLLNKLSSMLNIDFVNEEGEGTIMLKDAMTKEMIMLDYDAKDWEDAVRKAGELLKRTNCVGDEYIESMVQTVKNIGTYIVISKGIALPHSQSGKDAYKVGISLLRLKNPIYFGHPENDPVSLVFALSSIDSNSHLSALQDLASFLGDENNVELLKKADSIDDVYKLIMKG